MDSDGSIRGKEIRHDNGGGMTKQEESFLRMYAALKRITQYQSPERLRRSSRKEWGLDYEEALEGSYENVIQEAKDGIKGVRLPKSKE